MARVWQDALAVLAKPAGMVLYAAGSLATAVAALVLEPDDPSGVWWMVLWAAATVLGFGLLGWSLTRTAASGGRGVGTTFPYDQPGRVTSTRLEFVGEFSADNATEDPLSQRTVLERVTVRRWAALYVRRSEWVAASTQTDSGAAYTQVWPERHVGRWGWVNGSTRDVDVESIDFNRRWRLYSEDLGSSYRILTPVVIDLLARLPFDAVVTWEPGQVVVAVPRPGVPDELVELSRELADLAPRDSDDDARTTPPVRPAVTASSVVRRALETVVAGVVAMAAVMAVAMGLAWVAPDGPTAFDNDFAGALWSLVLFLVPPAVVFLAVRFVAQFFHALDVNAERRRRVRHRKQSPRTRGDSPQR